MPNGAESKMRVVPYEKRLCITVCLFSRVQALLIDNAGILLLHRPPPQMRLSANFASCTGRHGHTSTARRASGGVGHPHPVEPGVCTSTGNAEATIDNPNANGVAGPLSMAVA